MPYHDRRRPPQFSGIGGGLRLFAQNLLAPLAEQRALESDLMKSKILNRAAEDRQIRAEKRRAAQAKTVEDSRRLWEEARTRDARMQAQITWELRKRREDELEQARLDRPASREAYDIKLRAYGRDPRTLDQPGMEGSFGPGSGAPSWPSIGAIERAPKHESFRKSLPLGTDPVKPPAKIAVAREVSRLRIQLEATKVPENLWPTDPRTRDMYNQLVYLTRGDREGSTIFERLQRKGPPTAWGTGRTPAEQRHFLNLSGLTPIHTAIYRKNKDGSYTAGSGVIRGGRLFEYRENPKTGGYLKNPDGTEKLFRAPPGSYPVTDPEMGMTAQEARYRKRQLGIMISRMSGGATNIEELEKRGFVGNIFQPSKGMPHRFELTPRAQKFLDQAGSGGTAITLARAIKEAALKQPAILGQAGALSSLAQRFTSHTKQLLRKFRTIPLMGKFVAENPGGVGGFEERGILSWTKGKDGMVLEATLKDGKWTNEWVKAENAKDIGNWERGQDHSTVINNTFTRIEKSHVWQTMMAGGVSRETVKSTIFGLALHVLAARGIKGSRISTKLLNLTITEIAGVTDSVETFVAKLDNLERRLIQPVVKSSLSIFMQPFHPMNIYAGMGIRPDRRIAATIAHESTYFNTENGGLERGKTPQTPGAAARSGKPKVRPRETRVMVYDETKKASRYETEEERLERERTDAGLPEWTSPMGF